MSLRIFSLSRKLPFKRSFTTLHSCDCEKQCLMEQIKKDRPSIIGYGLTSLAIITVGVSSGEMGTFLSSLIISPIPMVFALNNVERYDINHVIPLRPNCKIIRSPIMANKYSSKDSDAIARLESAVDRIERKITSNESSSSNMYGTSKEQIGVVLNSMLLKRVLTSDEDEGDDD